MQQPGQPMQGQPYQETKAQKVMREGSMLMSFAGMAAGLVSTVKNLKQQGPAAAAQSLAQQVMSKNTPKGSPQNPLQNPPQNPPAPKS